ncbi:MAG TPA: hypothetical protein PLY86_09180 [bacterium]|nr:hypothetical protein [bacterium]
MDRRMCFLLFLLFFVGSAWGDLVLLPNPNTTSSALEIGTNKYLYVSLYDTETSAKQDITYQVRTTVDDPQIVAVNMPVLAPLSSGETVLHISYEGIEPVLQLDIAITVTGTAWYESLVFRPRSSDGTGELVAENQFQMLYGDDLSISIYGVLNTGKEVSMLRAVNLTWDDNGVLVLTSGLTSTSRTFQAQAAGTVVFHASLGGVLEAEPLTVTVFGIETFRFGPDLQALREFDTVSTLYAIYGNGKEVAVNKVLYRLSSSDEQIVGVNTTKKMFLAREKGECTLRMEFSGDVPWFGGTFGMDFPARIIAAAEKIETNPISLPEPIPVGQQVTLQTLVQYDDGEVLSKEVSWSYSSALADLEWLDDHFILTGEEAGATVLRPYLSDHRRLNGPPLPVEFYVPIDTITVSPSPLVVNLGETQRVTLEVTRTDKTQETRTDGVWTVEPPIGSVRDSTFYAEEVGQAIITGRIADRDRIYEASTTVRVDDWLEGIEISPTSVEMTVNDTQTFEVYALYASGTRQAVQTDSKTKWTLSNSAIGTLSNNVFESSGVGTGVVTASYNSRTNSAVVTVENPLTEITVKPSGSLSAEVYETLSFTATGTFVDGTDISLTDFVDWLSSDEAVARFDGSTLKILKAGTTQIRAQYRDLLSVPVSIEVPVQFLSLEVTPGPFVELSVGDREVFHAEAVYSDGRREDVSDQAEWNTTSSSGAVELNRNEILAVRGGTAGLIAHYEDRESVPVGIWVDRSPEVPKLTMNLNRYVSGSNFHGPDIIELSMMGRRVLVRADEKGEFEATRFPLPSGEAKTGRLTATGWFNADYAEIDVPLRASGTYSSEKLETWLGKISLVKNVVYPGEFLEMQAVPYLHPEWLTGISEVGNRFWRASGIFEIDLAGLIGPNPPEGGFAGTLKTTSTGYTIWDAPDFVTTLSSEPAGLPPLLDGRFSVKSYISAFCNPQPGNTQHPLRISGFMTSQHGTGETEMDYYIQPGTTDYLSLLADTESVVRGGTFHVRAAYHVPNAMEESVDLAISLPEGVTVVSAEPEGWEQDGDLLIFHLTLTPTDGTSNDAVTAEFRVDSSAPDVLDFFACFRGTLYTLHYSDPVRVLVEPDLALELEPERRYVSAGELVTLNLTVHANSPLRTARVQVYLPDGFDLDLSESSSGMTLVGNSVVSKFSMPDGGAKSFVLNGRIQEDISPVVTQLCFNAKGIGVHLKGDTVFADPQETALFLTPILLTLRAEEEHAAPGDSIHYTLIVSNGTQREISGLDLSVDLPSDVDVRSAPTGWSVESGELHWTISSLPAGRSLEQKFELGISTEWSVHLPRIETRVRSRLPYSVSNCVATWIARGAWGFVQTTYADLLSINAYCPVGGAQVAILQNGETKSETETDSVGFYQVEGLTPGNYTLEVQKGFDGYAGTWEAVSSDEYTVPVYDFASQIEDRMISIGPVYQLFAPEEDEQVRIPSLTTEFSGSEIEGGIVHRFEDRTIVFPGRGFSFERTLPGFPNLVSETHDLVYRMDLNGPWAMLSSNPLIRYELALLAINEINEYNLPLILDIADGLTVALENIVRSLIVLAKMRSGTPAGAGALDAGLSAVLAQEISKGLADMYLKLTKIDPEEAARFKRALAFVLPLQKAPFIALGQGGKDAAEDFAINLGFEIGKIVVDEWLLNSITEKNRKKLDSIRLSDYATQIGGSHDIARRAVSSLLWDYAVDTEIAHLNYEGVKSSYDWELTQRTEAFVDLIASVDPQSEFAAFSVTLKGLRTLLVGGSALNSLRQWNENINGLGKIVKTTFQPEGVSGSAKVQTDVAPSEASDLPLVDLWIDSEGARNAMRNALLNQSRAELEAAFPAFQPALKDFEWYLDLFRLEWIERRNLLSADDECLQVDEATDDYHSVKVEFLTALLGCSAEAGSWAEALEQLDEFEQNAQVLIDWIEYYVANGSVSFSSTKWNAVSIRSAEFSSDPLTPDQTATLTVEITNLTTQAVSNVYCVVDAPAEIVLTNGNVPVTVESSQTASFTYGVELAEDALNGPFQLFLTVYSGETAKAYGLVSGSIAEAKEAEYVDVRNWRVR